MLILVETSAGYALFTVEKEKKLGSIEGISKIFENEESASK